METPEGAPKAAAAPDRIAATRHYSREQSLAYTVESYAARIAYQDALGDPIVSTPGR